MSGPTPSDDDKPRVLHEDTAASQRFANMSPEQRQDLLDDHLEKVVSKVLAEQSPHLKSVATARVTTGDGGYLRTEDSQSVRTGGGPLGGAFNDTLSRVKSEVEPLVEKMLERVNQISAADALEGKAILQSLESSTPLVMGQALVSERLASLESAPASATDLRDMTSELRDVKTVLEARGMKGSDAHKAVSVMHDEALKTRDLASAKSMLDDSVKFYAENTPGEKITTLETEASAALKDVAKDLAKTWGDNAGSRAINNVVSAIGSRNHEAITSALADAVSPVQAMVAAQSQRLQETAKDAMPALDAITAPMRAQMDNNTDKLAQLGGLEAGNDDLLAKITKVQALSLAITREELETWKSSASAASSSSSIESGKSSVENAPTKPGISVEAGAGVSIGVAGASGAETSASTPGNAGSPLKEAIHGHLEQKGYDTEALSRSGEMAAAVEGVLANPPSEPSMMIFGKEGDALLSLTSESDKVASNETAVSLETLSFVKDNGMPREVVDAVRNFVPEGTRRMSDLEVADAVGPQFIERAQAEGFPHKTLDAAAEAMQKAQDGSPLPTPDTKVDALNAVVEPFASGKSHEETLAMVRSDLQAQQQTQQKAEKVEAQAAAEMAMAM